MLVLKSCYLHKITRFHKWVFQSDLIINVWIEHFIFIMTLNENKLSNLWEGFWDLYFPRHHLEIALMWSDLSGFKIFKSVRLKLRFGQRCDQTRRKCELLNIKQIPACMQLTSTRDITPTQSDSYAPWSNLICIHNGW